MHHTMNARTEFIKQTLHYRGIRSSRTQHEFSCINGCTIHFVLQTESPAIDKFFRNSMVVALGIFLSQILSKNIMTSTRQTIRAHSAIIFFLVSGLPTTAQTYNNVAWTNIGIVDNIAALHSTRYRTVHNYRTNQVAHISRFTSGSINTYAHITHLLEKFVSTIYNSTYYLARNEHLVATNRTGNKYIVYRAHTE